MSSSLMSLITHHSLLITFSLITSDKSCVIAPLAPFSYIADFLSEHKSL
jgi:hypothetical protein